MTALCVSSESIIYWTVPILIHHELHYTLFHMCRIVLQNINRECSDVKLLCLICDLSIAATYGIVCCVVVCLARFTSVMHGLLPYSDVVFSVICSNIDCFAVFEKHGLIFCLWICSYLS